MDFKQLVKELDTAVNLYTYKNDLYIEINTRLPTLNEILSANQYKRWDVFAYKSKVKEIVNKKLSEIEKPFFIDCELIIYRNGKKLMDVDSLPASLKYFIDTLSINNIIVDDNPNFVHSIKCYQQTFKQSGNKQYKTVIKVKKTKKRDIDMTDFDKFIKVV